MTPTPTWILGTIAGALKLAHSKGYEVQWMHLNPIDHRAVERIATLVHSILIQITGVIFVADERITRGFTRLECVPLAAGAESAPKARRPN